MALANQHDALFRALKYAFRKGITREILARLLRDPPEDDPLTMQVLRYMAGC